MSYGNTAREIVTESAVTQAFCVRLSGEEAALRGVERRPHSFAPGEALYRESDSARNLYVIKQGLVKLVSHLPNGRVRIVRLHARGSLVGLGSFFEATHRHSAVAVGQVVADSIPLAALRRLRDSDPLAYCDLLERWQAQLGDADTWITEFSTGSIRARVARLVNFLSELENAENATEVRLLTCEDMAAVLGVTPESVSRVLAEFKRGRMLRCCVNQRSVHRFERDIDALRTVALD